jgi:hypothetical protein
MLDNGRKEGGCVDLLALRGLQLVSHNRPIAEVAERLVDIEFFLQAFTLSTLL